MLQIVLLFIGFSISYIFIKPFLKVKEYRNLLLKILLFLAPASLIGYGIVTYINHKPDSFTEGVELLKETDSISAKIGTFDSYSYYEKDLPKETDNPAKFKVSLNGDSASIYVTCVVIKNSKGKWNLKSVQQDNIVKNKNN
jgi:hypothetical protein